jgi:riboflavin synthase
MTTLQEKNSGDRVNIETDIIARYIARLLGVEETRSKATLNLDFLAKNGFL